MHSAQAAVDELQSQISGLLDILERTPSDALVARAAQLEVSLKAAQEARDEISELAAQAESRSV